MTADSWFTSVTAKLKAFVEGDFLLKAAGGAMIDVSERVWGRGELTDGSKLTYNENYEVYGYKPPLPRKPSGLGKNGGKIKGGYYPTYLALKAQQGRSDLPFELTGDLRIDYLGGSQVSPKRLDDVTYAAVLDGRNAEKWRGLTKTKGEFLRLNDRERARYRARLENDWSSIQR